MSETTQEETQVGTCTVCHGKDVEVKTTEKGNPICTDLVGCYTRWKERYDETGLVL